jgi:hypothetical protein
MFLPAYQACSVGMVATIYATIVLLSLASIACGQSIVPIVSSSIVKKLKIMNNGAITNGNNTCRMYLAGYSQDIVTYDFDMDTGAFIAIGSSDSGRGMPSFLTLGHNSSIGWAYSTNEFADGNYDH